MNVPSYFSASYSEARQKFLAACAARGLIVESLPNPHAKGRDGEDLFMDIARIGKADTPKVLFLMSGTHGVEGYCGSGAQIGCLETEVFAGLPDDISVVMVHAMNPYGFSHDRRVNEDNVDLNRNFLDFSKPDRPQNDYGALHEHVLPDNWEGAAKDRANAALLEYMKAHGQPAFQQAVSGGQYTHADGIFFGGKKATWSNETFSTVLRNYARGAKVAGFIDFHTGLGPYGYGEPISDGSADTKARTRRWYGDDVTDPDKGESTSAPLVGTIPNGVETALPETALSFIALEYGTRDINTVLSALRGDNWLYHKGDLETDLGRQIKRDIRDAFYPEEDDWKQQVWTRAREIAELAIEGLKAEALMSRSFFLHAGLILCASL